MAKENLEDLKKENNILKKELAVLKAAFGISNSLFLNLDEILEKFLHLAINFVSTDAGSILLLNENNELEFKITTGEKSKEIKKFTLTIGEGVAGWCMESGMPVMVQDVTKDERFNKKISDLIDFPTYSLLCVPLRKKGKTYGVLELVNKKEDLEFNEEDEKLVEMLADQMTIAIENKELILQTQEQLESLHKLTEVSKVITSSLDLQEVLSKVMELATAPLKAQASSLMLLNEKENVLVFQVAKGSKGEEAKKIKIPLGKGIAGWVAQTGESILIEDAYKDKRFNQEVDKKTGFKTKSILCVPLKVKNKIIGVVQVLNKNNNKSFNKEDLSLFETLAAQAAIAIDNANLFEDLKDLFYSTVTSLAEAIEAKSLYTMGHVQRVSQYARTIAEEMNLSADEVENVYLSALLHDVGKIGISENILNKPDKLTEQEWAEARRHPEIGEEILKPVKLLKDVLPGVKYHQEYFNGKGYPENLSGEKIPLIARIICLADSFDVMTSDRPYRKRKSDTQAVDEVKKCSGSQFDPQVVEAFLSAYNKNKIHTPQN